LTVRSQQGQAEILVGQFGASRPGSRDDHLVAPGDHGEHVLRQAGHQRIDAGLLGQRRRQFQSRAVADRDPVVEAVLARPLGEAADHIDGLAADLPALEFVLADGAHRPAGQHAPLAFGDLGHRRRLAVDDGGHRADAERGIHLEDVAAERAFQVVHVLRRGEDIQVETGAAFAVDIDGVALVEVDAPGSTRIRNYGDVSKDRSLTVAALIGAPTVREGLLQNTRSYLRNGVLPTRVTST
jgi:hypothetical protein